MSTGRKLATVTDEPQSLFGSKTVEIGGTTYTLHELNGKVYDECVELAREPDGVNTVVLLKFMVEKSIEPKMSMSQINELPMSKRRDLIEAVNDLHFPPVGKALNA
jgi:hypothetical protein